MQEPKESWHHIWAFDLYVGSKPVNLDGECGGDDWASVKTETSFLNGLAEVFTSPVWHPETVTVRCAKPETTATPPAQG
jgi:hypothetical protein